MLLAKVNAIDARVSLILMSDGSRQRRIEYDRMKKSDYIIQDFVRLWSSILRIPPFRFECNAEESTYITRPLHAEKIHRYSSMALDRPCTLFIDAFACVGGDTLASMNQFKQADIFAVQRIDANEHGRFDRLQRNIEVFKDIVQRRRPGSIVEAIGLDIQSFIRSYDKPLSDHSILYIDPPWVLNPAETTYSTAAQINSFLTTEIWTPLDQTQTYPSVIVLKLPHDNIRNIASWPKLRAQYAYFSHYTPKRNFTAYILKRQKPVLPFRPP
jgi:hypothetical protein